MRACRGPRDPAPGPGFRPRRGTFRSGTLAAIAAAAVAMPIAYTQP